MKPEFSEYRTQLSKKPTSIRLPNELQRMAELIARLENDSVTGIIIEGLARVVNDRRNDTEYIQSLLQAQADITSTTVEALGYVPKDLRPMV